MRLLFVTGPTPSNVFALAPLALAARDAGHQVFMSTVRERTSVVTGVGLPALAATTTPLADLKATRRSGEREHVPDDVDHPEFIRYTGRWFGRVAAESLVTLREVAAAWRPDVVIGGPHAYAAALLAHELSVPWVRHTWTALDTRGIHIGSEAELAPELGQARPRPDTAPGHAHRQLPALDPPGRRRSRPADPLRPGQLPVHHRTLDVHPRRAPQGLRHGRQHGRP